MSNALVDMLLPPCQREGDAPVKGVKIHCFTGQQLPDDS